MGNINGDIKVTGQHSRNPNSNFGRPQELNMGNEKFSFDSSFTKSIFDNSYNINITSDKGFKGTIESGFGQDVNGNRMRYIKDKDGREIGKVEGTTRSNAYGRIDKVTMNGMEYERRPTGRSNMNGPIYEMIEIGPAGSNTIILDMLSDWLETFFIGRIIKSIFKLAFAMVIIVIVGAVLLTVFRMIMFFGFDITINTPGWFWGLW